MVLPRVYLGIIFLVSAYFKIAAPAGFPKVLAGFLNNVALAQGYPWYRDVVRVFVLPHVAFFAVLVTAGEVFVGIAMLLGIATRLGSVVAIVLLLNYLCAKGLPIWSPASNDTADIVMALTVGIGSAGRTYGFDRIIARRLPRGAARFIS